MSFKVLRLDNNECWRYFVGKNNILIQSPKGRKFIVNKDEFGFNFYPDSVIYIISPQKIKDYILSNLIHK